MIYRQIFPISILYYSSRFLSRKSRINPHKTGKNSTDVPCFYLPIRLAGSPSAVSGYRIGHGGSEASANMERILTVPFGSGTRSTVICMGTRVWAALATITPEFIDKNKR